VNGPLLEEDRELERRRPFPIATIVVVAASVTLNGAIPTEMGLLECLERVEPL